MNKRIDDINDLSCNSCLILHSFQRRHPKNAEHDSSEASLCSSQNFCSSGTREKQNIVDRIFLLVRNFYNGERKGVSLINKTFAEPAIVIFNFRSNEYSTATAVVYPILFQLLTINGFKISFKFTIAIHFIETQSQETERLSGNAVRLYRNVYVILKFTQRPKTPVITFEKIWLSLKRTSYLQMIFILL